MPEIRKRSVKGQETARSAVERMSLYEEVTRRIAGEVEAERFLWVQPWSATMAGGISPALPRNAVTGRTYSGVNILILWSEMGVRAYRNGPFSACPDRPAAPLCDGESEIPA